MKRSSLTGLAGCLLLVAMVGMAQAAPAYYYNDPVADRAAFQAASGPLTTESFEDYFTSASLVSFPVGGPQAFTVSVSSGNLNQNGFSRLVTDGQYALAFEEAGTSTVTFTFDAPINAFGIAVNDMNFGSMSFADGLGNSLPEVLWGDNANGATDGDMTNHQFFGVTNATAFSSVALTFEVTDPTKNGTLALDYLQYGQCNAVPAPGAAWLVGVGLVGVFRMRRRAKI
ncbi:MAG: hypothetical protein JW741_21115 [Sedimentisphaerales bacterium]|nr:hypothetical protein [Sedimentisphaerales bacterium]